MVMIKAITLHYSSIEPFINLPFLVGMMSLINTNYSYLRTMQITQESPIVGIMYAYIFESLSLQIYTHILPNLGTFWGHIQSLISFLTGIDSSRSVSVYYLGCAIGAVIASYLADKHGRRPSIFACLATTAFGNLLMFISGLSPHGSSAWNGGALGTMISGRIIMGLGVGGIDATIPVYSSEISSDGARGRALAQEFQMNIFGLLMAYSVNLGVTRGLGKENEWAWRTPIILMQIFPILLMSFISQLPETPRVRTLHPTHTTQST